jgi:hypothetical protein
MSRNPEERRMTPRGGVDNKERPGSVALYKHSLSPLEGASEGASCGDPYGTASWNPDGKRKTRSGEASLIDLQTRDKPYNNKRLSIQDSTTKPGPHKTVKHRQEGRTKPREGGEQAPTSNKAGVGPECGPRQADGGSYAKVSNIKREAEPKVGLKGPEEGSYGKISNVPEGPGLQQGPIGQGAVPVRVGRQTRGEAVERIPTVGRDWRRTRTLTGDKRLMGENFAHPAR